MSSAADVQRKLLKVLQTCQQKLNAFELAQVQHPLGNRAARLRRLP